MTTDVRDARGAAEEGFHEIQLSGKQLVFLFMATTVVSIVIFLCGVLVGRGVRAGDLSAEAAPAPAVETALGDGVAPQEQGQGSAEATPPQPADQPNPAETMGADELTYYKMLGADEPPAETVGAAAPQPPPAEPAPEAARRDEAPRPPASAEPATTTPAPAADLVPPKGGRFTVQVAALRERSEADVIARRLAARGYPAFVEEPSGRGDRMYRVRVGAFRERREADQLSARLRKDEQFKPWVTTR